MTVEELRKNHWLNKIFIVKDKYTNKTYEIEGFFFTSCMPWRSGEIGYYCKQNCNNELNIRIIYVTYENDKISFKITRMLRNRDIPPQYEIIDMKECNKDKYKPFDVVIYKPTGERGLVKSTNDIGAFVLFRIQSTAALCKYEDLELE
ncbi:MAG: hypothetical protein IJH39_11830 [Clostridia bacterium]|nr:hypothetical protein [Clostridia bacterium]